jgi:hypothetical protein
MKCQLSNCRKRYMFRNLQQCACSIWHFKSLQISIIIEKEITMRSLLRIAVMFAALALVTGTSQATIISLGTAADFAVLGGSGVSNTGMSTFTGDVGSWPTSAITGVTASMVNGTLYPAADPATELAHTDLIAAFTTAKNAVGGIPGQLGNLGGANLTSGVYTYAAAATWTGAGSTLTLDGLGDSSAQWIFQIGTALTTPADITVALVNGASANNVFWQIGSSFVSGANNTFAGNILAQTSITLGGGTLEGRALAIDGAVTIGTQQSIKAIPEPMTISLLSLGALGLVRRKQ